MYEGFFGLRERPFDLTPNPRFLLLTSKHREALSNLQYGLSSRRGITLLVGEAGTGKTTLVKTVVGDLEGKGALIAYLNNPTLSRTEFCEFLAASYGLSAAARTSKTALLEELSRKLAERHAAGLLTGLVIDEAQSLPVELLEEVRLLANIETVSEKLLPLVLAGQPELADRLNQPSLRQLKQRVALRCELQALDARETAEYIASRIRIAGGNSALVFTRQAVDCIFEHSKGIPRLISVLCDNSMISGFAADRRPINREIVADVCRDFDINGVHTALADNGNHRAVFLPEPEEIPQTSLPAPPEAMEPAAAAGNGQPVRGLFEHFKVRRRFSLF
jgi:type II secretory pathway predicted ATPase ExeA